MNAPVDDSHILALDRPNRALWTYYIISALLTGPGLVVMLPYLFFRYHTLRYRFDEEGIHMKVGILFRREVNLTYARIQDIHLKSGILQRWLGLANLEVQTASGSSATDLVIEGFKEYEAIRDFLYKRMRGYHARQGQPSATDKQLTVAGTAGANNEMVAILQGIRDEMRQTREFLEAKGSTQSTPPRHV